MGFDKAHIKLLLRVSATFIVIILFIAYYIKNQSDLAIILNLSLIDALLVAAIELLIILTNTLYIKKILDYYGLRDTWHKLSLVTFKSSVINFFGFLQGGTGYRAFYLKKAHGLSYKDFAGLLALNYISLFFVSSVFGVVGLFLRNTKFTTNDRLLFLFFLSVIMVCAIVTFVPLLVSHRYFVKISPLIRKVQKTRSLLFKFIYISLVQYCLSFFITLVLLNSVGASPTISGALVYAAVAQFSILLAITPSAIGIKEGLLIATNSSLGVSMRDIVLSATVERSVYFFLLLILAFYFFLRKEKIRKIL